jgi:hypothetical protein
MLVTSAVALVQIAVLFGLPWMLVLIASGSWGLAQFVVTAAYVIFLLFSVWSISLSPEGIRFKRVLGGPKFLAWKDVLVVEPVSRLELILRGWLWPIFPPRELTACLSSIGHYKISWQGGYCYFPPNDTETFERHVTKHMVRSRGAADPHRPPIG